MAKKSFSKNVKFSQLSIGETTARLGCNITRENLELEDADSIFAGSRCSAKIEMKDDPGQTTMIVNGKDMTKVDPIEAVVDIKRYNVSRDMFTTGLTIQLSEVDVSKVAKFANREGKLTLKRTGDIPDHVKDEADELAGEEEDDGKSPDPLSRRGR